MSDILGRYDALNGIKEVMTDIQRDAERLAACVLWLEADGETNMASMKRIAQILAEIALGWEVGSGGI